MVLLDIENNLEAFKEWLNPILTVIFVIGATVSGIWVAGKFLTSPDKKEAMTYAMWWIVGVAFYALFRALINEIMEQFLD